MRSQKVLIPVMILALVTSAGAAISVSAAPLRDGGSVTRQIAISGTSSFQSGSEASEGLQWPEFAGAASDEPGAAPYNGTIVDRSRSTHPGHGASVNSGKKAKSHPGLGNHFDGLNFVQQRRANSGNQFSVEPPDQALCAGNGYVVEAVNDVFNVYNFSGVSQLPANNVGGAVDLNTFFGYPAAINRITSIRGPFVTDPVCLFDAPTQRFFLAVLTLDTFPTTGRFTGKNHLDLAVSQTSNPTGSWNIYRLPVQDDGTDGTPNHHCAPGPGSQFATNPTACIGDYPHIGADAYGLYLTTNEYDLFGPNFHAAQIYAISKAALASGAPNVTIVQFDTIDTVNATAPVARVEPGFTVWPAQSPGTSFEDSLGGTEYFMSSNAADEAAGSDFTGSSTNLIVWALTNTSSLDTASPTLSLTNTVLNVNPYGVPPKAKQPGSGTPADSTTTPNVPLGDCINDTTTATSFGPGCWRLLFLPPGPAHDEVISRLDANDTRMQQVDFANGKLWGALDTALTIGNETQAGIAWFIIKPSIASTGVSATVAKQGYLGVAGADLTYPAIGVTPSGRGVMAFTFTGDNTFPSAAYAPIDAQVGVGDYTIIKAGLGVDDGFTSYKAFVGSPPRTRWGDYGAAAVDGKSVWIASEYIGQSCSYAQWLATPLGGCPGAGYPPAPLNRTRDVLGNWYTHISQLTP
jgi:hypothetical protein